MFCAEEGAVLDRVAFGGAKELEKFVARSNFFYLLTVSLFLVHSVVIP